MVGKHPIIYSDDVWTVYLEIGVDSLAFLHFDLHKPWSKTVYLHMKSMASVIAAAFRVKGFTRVFCATEDPVVKKFAARLNFKETNLEVIGEDNIKRGVQVCHLH